MDSVGGVMYWAVDMGMGTWHRLDFALVGILEEEVVVHFRSNQGK